MMINLNTRTKCLPKKSQTYVSICKHIDALTHKTIKRFEQIIQDMMKDTIIFEFPTKRADIDILNKLNLSLIDVIVHSEATDRATLLLFNKKHLDKVKSKKHSRYRQLFLKYAITGKTFAFNKIRRSFKNQHNMQLNTSKLVNINEPTPVIIPVNKLFHNQPLLDFNIKRYGNFDHIRFYLTFKILTAEYPINIHKAVYKVLQAYVTEEIISTDNTYKFFCSIRRLMSRAGMQMFQKPNIEYFLMQAFTRYIAELRKNLREPHGPLTEEDYKIKQGLEELAVTIDEMQNKTKSQ